MCMHVQQATATIKVKSGQCQSNRITMAATNLTAVHAYRIDVTVQLFTSFFLCVCVYIWTYPKGSHKKNLNQISKYLLNFFQKLSFMAK